MKTKKTYKVTGMDCASCAQMIELDLGDAGVNAKCNYAKEILEVEFDPQKVAESKIKKVVKSSGYNLS
jgi:copper chaperone CopZ